MKCAHHPERAALGYCAGCGKPLCGGCLVRLRTGNYCDVCANPETRAVPRRRIPWWVVGVLVLAALILFRGLFR